jgi:hypothetical protein
MPPKKLRRHARRGRETRTAKASSIQCLARGRRVSAEDSLRRAEDLLERLERTRQELESTQDPDRAIEILGELAEIAKEVEAELQRAKESA